MLNYTADFLAGMTAETALKENSPPLSQYNYRLDRSTGSPSSTVSESSSPSSDSVSDMILALDKKAAIVTPGSKPDKPSHSYIALISMAILSSKDNKMVLGDIYELIMKTYPFYNNHEKAWRNSIRHNLSINECFIKNGRAENGKGNFWSIHPACVEDFSKGDFRRRHARRRARKGTKDINRNYQYLSHGNPMYISVTPSRMGYQPMSSSTVGYQPMSSSPVGYQPMSSSPVGYQPISSSTVGYQPMSSSPSGYQHILSPQMCQPMTPSSFGYQPLTTAPASNVAFLPAITGSDSIPPVSQSYHPYQVPAVSRQSNNGTRNSSNVPTITSYPTVVHMSPVDQFPFTLANLLNCNADMYPSLG